MLVSKTKRLEILQYLLGKTVCGLLYDSLAGFDDGYEEVQAVVMSDEGTGITNSGNWSTEESVHKEGPW